MLMPFLITNITSHESSHAVKRLTNKYVAGCASLIFAE
ncbi:hypothetical protein M2315_004235 [Agrobacterium fabrum]|nr:hypothetical protein [Agrobacterium fabrum]